MIEHRPFTSLGRVQMGWLDARHHFSFGRYFDPKRSQWGALRVWNDDEIQPHSGFDPHPHRDMEIITYVRDGAITHQDSMGNEGRTEAGDVQVMSAGRGVVHAEYNREDQLARLFQIWIEPTESGGEPYWEAAKFPDAGRAGQLVVLASGRKGDVGALPIRADARVLGATVNAGGEIRYAAGRGRHVYLALARGSGTLGGLTLHERDGAAVKDVDEIVFRAAETAEIVVVDAP